MDTIRRSITFQRSTAALGLLAALAVAACGGGGPGASAGPGATQAPGAGTATQAPGPGAAIDVCALLTEADIEEVTGNTVESTTPGAQAGIFQTGCAWQLIDEDAFVPPEIALGVLTPGGKDYYAKYFEPFNEGAGYEPVDNLGDIAVDAEAGAVLVVTGDTFFNLQYIGLTADDTAIAADLARKVVANLAK